MNRRVIAAVDDMIFAAKIKGTAAAVGASVEFVRRADAAVAAIERELPSLLIADLHSEKYDPFALAVRLKAEPRFADIKILGFFSHVNIELKNRAVEAGFDQVLPRSAFVKRLGEILAEGQKQSED